MSPKSISTDFEELLNYLYGLRRLGVKTGLQHTRQLLACCGNPEKTFQSIHIAGTNGKGSVAAMTASILRKRGLKVGLYTSPHLIRFNERIRVNGRPLGDDFIVSFIREYRQEIQAIQSTFFETTSALAFSYFAAEKVDVALVETGLGGRLDSTNVLSPTLTAITPVSMDHREFLGNSLQKIAAEKAGIIKPGVPVVLGPQKKEALSVLEAAAVQQAAPLEKIEPVQFTEVTVSPQGTTFRYRGKVYGIPLLGHHQAINAGMAIQITSWMAPDLLESEVKSGLKKVQWPGRLQMVCSTPPVYYDVAHNAHGLEVVTETLRQLYDKEPVILLVLKGDKELDFMATELGTCSGELLISGAEHQGLMDSKTLALKLSPLLNRGFQEIPDFAQAMETLVRRAQERETCGLITGSHYVAGDIFKRFDFPFQNGRI